ncbi:DNA-binding protein WhiA [Bulleidia sp. zg-1006]|uniref:DNA-binding protein WhiA n=1 Tax=Bulleidia sp. zg-1006 TaxID=2806552 RepID=UPI00193A0F6F|nr:DNA-binding protein WhiA [Bulleidia sp. zg-1006]QRG86786.1 DNA-binding protein WhiA [Bulleidia sp. zg-1006]
MSFATEVKAEVAAKKMNEKDGRACLSSLLQLCSSLILSNGGFQLIVSTENAAVARLIVRLIKELYQSELELFIKKKMNLKKNIIYGLRIYAQAKPLLEDLGLWSSRGLLAKPLAKMVVSSSQSRAYLAGCFLACGSINNPEKSSYHLEISANSQGHAKFIQAQMNKFYIQAKIIQRRNKWVVYVKSAEKIADFLRLIEADEAVMNYENIRLSRDFSNSITRLNNMDVANEVKSQNAAMKQLEDIHLLEQRGVAVDKKLAEVIRLRKEYPESSLVELCLLYERETGMPISKSGMKHRFVKIHELVRNGF